MSHELSAAELTNRVADAVASRSDAAEVQVRLRSYPPVWELAHWPAVLDALLAAAQQNTPYWWRPARVALLATATWRGLSGYQAAERWLLDEGKQLLFVAAGEASTEDLPAGVVGDAEAYLAQTLIRDAWRALYQHSRSAPAEWVSLSEGVLVCLYDFSSRVSSRPGGASWLVSVARERPVTAAKVLLLNNDSGDCLTTVQRIAAALSAPRALAFIHAVADVGEPGVAVTLAQQLYNSSPQPSAEEAPERLAEAALGHLHRGMAAALGEPSAAVSELERGLVSGRALAAELAHQLGRAHRRESHLEAALEAYRLGLELTPASAELRAAACDALYELGRYQDALEVLEAAPAGRAAAGHDLEWQRARALAVLDQRDAAIAAAVAAADLADTPGQQHQVAHLLSDLGEVGRAIASMAQAVASEPSQADWQGELGDLYASQSDWHAAESCYRQQVALHPTDATALLRLASARRAQGNYAGALEVASEAAQLQPRNARALQEWAATAHAAGHWETAIRAGQATLSLLPDSAQVYTLMGQAYGALNQDEEALYHLRRATQLPDENPADSWLALVQFYQERGHTGQAEKALDEGVRAVGEQHAASLLLRLAMLYEETGRPTEAQSAYWRAYQAGNCSTDLLTRLGQVLSQLGHHEQAVAKLEEAAARPDANGETYHVLALALETDDRIAEATSAARRAAVLRPTDGQTLLDAGRLCLKAGDSSQAVALLQDAVARLPQTPVVWDWLGQALEAEEVWAAALDAYWSVARLDPGNPRTQHRIGVVCTRLGQYQTAITSLKEAADRLPNSPSVKDALAEALEGTGWWEGAARVRQQAAELAPTSAARLAAWAKASRHAGDLPAALDAIAQARLIAPDSDQVLLEWGLLQRERDDTAGAIQSLRQVASGCRQPVLLWQAGDALVEMDQTAAGAAAFGRAVDLNPDDPAAQARLGDASVALGDPAQALAAYQAAARLEPANPAHQLALAKLHWELNQFALAAQAWEAAHGLLPDDEVVMEQLAGAYARIGSHAAALEMYERAANQAALVGSTTPSLWREAARAALELGELDKAHACLTHALQGSPSDPETHSLAGLLADLRGRREDALECFKQAARLAPGQRSYQLQVADALTNLGCDADALEVWKELLGDGNSDAETVSVLGQMGRLYARVGRHEDAERALRAALEHAPKDGALQRELGSVLVERAELADYLQRAGVLVPDGRHGLEQACTWLAHGDSAQEQRDLARARLLLDGVNEAITGLNVYFSSAGKPASGDLGALRALGVAYRRAGLLDASQTALASALELAPDDARTAGELAETHLAAGEPQQALDLLGQLVEPATEDPILLYHCGRAARAAGNIEWAMNAMGKAVELDPANGRWQRKLANWLRTERRAPAALPYAQAAARLEPEEAQARAELAQTYMDLERLEEAVPHWRKAVELSPENASWCATLGSVLLAVCKPDLASDSFARAAQLEPAEARHYLGRAEALLMLDRLDGAGRQTERALELAPELPSAHAGRGQWQAATGAWQEALASFQTAALLSGNSRAGVDARQSSLPAWVGAEGSAPGRSPGQPSGPRAGAVGYSWGAVGTSAERAYYLLHVAHAYHELGSPEQALQELERAVQLDPNLDPAFALMGDIHLEMGSRDLARQAYQQAAKVSPADPRHALRLAQFLQNEGQLDQALGCLIKAIEARPTVDLWLEAARVYRKRGQRGKQLESLHRAAALDPEHAGTHFELGLAHKQRKEYRLAVQEFEKAIELDPESQEAHKQLSAVVAISLTSGMGR